MLSPRKGLFWGLCLTLMRSHQTEGSIFRSSFIMKVHNGCESEPEISVQGFAPDNLLITTSLPPKQFSTAGFSSFLRPWDEAASEDDAPVFLKFECDNYLFPCKLNHTVTVKCAERADDAGMAMELEAQYLFSRTSQDLFFSSFMTTIFFALAVIVYSSRFWENYLVYAAPRVGQQMKKCLDPPKVDKKNWLSNFYIDDLGDCSELVFLPEYPSTHNPDVFFRNDKGRFPIHDYPPPDEGYVGELRPNRIACVIGRGIPVALTNPPSATLMEHWRVNIPNYSRPVVKKIGKRYKFNTKKFISLFPIEKLEDENHVIPPAAHYEVLSKLAIPEMNVACPKHHKGATSFPCMIKCTHGLGSSGTYRAKSELEAKEIEEMLKNDFGCSEDQIVFTDVIMNIQTSYCAQFYLSKAGFIRWIGVSEQQVDEEVGKWIGGYFEHHQQPHYEEQCRPYCKPVAEYLHKKGFFGVVGIDILFNDEGGFVIDVNARINGSTPALLLAPEMSHMGFNYGLFKTGCKFAGTEEELVERVDAVNAQGHARVLVLCTTEIEAVTFLGTPILEAHIVAFTLIKSDVFTVIDDLLKQFDDTVV